jgi:hypothetical protein
MRLKPRRPRFMKPSEPLASLFDRYPDALSWSRQAHGLEIVPLSAIVGTVRHPSQNSDDFLPLPQLRGRNWESRWQRIQTAMSRLTVLPPVELLKLGDTYWVVDGHNRIAASLKLGAAAVDADVTELLPPGTIAASHADAHIGSAQTSLIGSETLRQAGEGRLSPRSEVLRGGPSRVEIAESSEDAAVPESSSDAAATNPPDEGRA